MLLPNARRPDQRRGRPGFSRALPPPVPSTLLLLSGALLTMILIVPGSARANPASGATATPHPSMAGVMGVPDARSTVSWSWPVAVPHRIVTPFIAPATDYAAGHRGVDIAAAAGSPVVAPADGIVTFVGIVVDRPVLSIRFEGGVLASFEPVDSDLIRGGPVRRGDTIATLRSGHCRSPCLHFGVRVAGEYVSPLNYLGGIPRAVLLPTRR